MLILSLTLIISILFILLCQKYWKITINYFVECYDNFKKHFFEVIVKGITGMKRVLNQLALKIEFSEKSKFSSLTPNDDGDRDDIYSKALNFALQNRDIKNIALTGPYGSGKSTVIRSFQKNFPNYKYLNISLASFKVGDETIDTELIEVSVLQQIFYHVKHKSIPDSRFKRIRKASKPRLLFKAIMLILWVCSFFFLSQKVLLPAIPESKELLQNYRLVLLSISLICFIGGGIYLIYALFKLYNNSKFNKVNLSSGEIEFSEHNETSVLNKHLDEILYFFEITNFNVVVIEDLDRFQNPEIFTKLREINNLINNACQVSRRIVFIYALKDDIFKEEKRTKFFDFVIPVIPVINASNSEAKLLIMAEEAELTPDISKDFIAEIALYIDDMRLLKNVVNEFILYRAKLGGFELNYDKLLSIILYKNIYPTDFSALNKKEGVVFTFFANKTMYLDRIKKTKSDRLAFIKQERATLVNSVVADKHELRSIYLGRMCEMLPEIAAGTIYIENTSLTLTELQSDENFTKLLDERSIYYYRSGYGKYQSSIGFTNVEHSINPDKTYSEREKELHVRSEYLSDQINKELEEIEAEFTKIDQLSFSDILDPLNNEELDHQVVNYELILFLIRNGYIDEDYNDYTSHFYEGSISRRDREYLLSIKNHKALPFDYKLDNEVNVIKKLKLREFSQPEIYNIMLVDEMLENRSLFKNQLDALLTYISKNTFVSGKFRDNYIEEGRNVHLFIKLLMSKWIEFWNFVSIDSGFSDDKKKLYMKLILENAELSVIKQLNSKDSLSSSINKQKDFLSIFSDTKSVSSIEKILKILNTKFINLEVSSKQDLIFNVIYVNDLYKLNPEMLLIILNAKLPEDKALERNFKRANYTTIMDSGLDKLINYIEYNIDEYINDVYLQIDENKYDSEEMLIKLYENEYLEYDVISLIISKQATVITSIKDVPEPQWNNIMKAGVLKPTWQNLYAYYLKVTVIDIYLRKFLNDRKNYQELAKLDASEVEGDENIIEQFVVSIMLDKEITTDSLKILLKAFPYEYEELAVGELHLDKIRAMLTYKVLLLSTFNYDLLKLKFPGLHIALVEQNAVSFIQHLSEYQLEASDINLILASTEFTIDQKIIVVQSLTEDFIRRNSSIVLPVIDLLLIRHLPIAYSILNALVTQVSDQDKQIKLLNLYMEDLSADQITEWLDVIGGKFADIADQKLQKLPDNDDHRTLALKLQNKGYISSPSYIDDHIRFNPFRKKKDQEE